MCCPSIASLLGYHATSQKSSSRENNQLEQCDERTTRLFGWLQENGVDCSNVSSGYEKNSVGVELRGLFAQKDIKQGASVIRIPKKYTIQENSVSGKSDFRGLITAEHIQSLKACGLDPETFKIAMCLIYQDHQVESEHLPFVDFLKEDETALTVPLCFTDAEMELYPFPGGSELLARKQKVISKIVGDLNESLDKKLAVKDVISRYAQVAARELGRSCGLVPVIDLANSNVGFENSPINVYVNLRCYDDSTDYVEFLATEDIKVGDPIHFEYGGGNPFDTLEMFGFVPPESCLDSLDIVISEGGQATLNTEGAKKIYTIETDSKGSPIIRRDTSIRAGELLPKYKKKNLQIGSYIEQLDKEIKPYIAKLENVDRSDNQDISDMNVQNMLTAAKQLHDLMISWASALNSSRSSAPPLFA